MSEDPIPETGRPSPIPPVRPPPLRVSLRKGAIDFSPLRRHRDFRLLWFGEGVSFFGSAITLVGIPFQTYQLTRSSFVVGLLGVAELVPLLGTSLFGGALADAVDRRKLLRIAEALLAVVSGVLVLNALSPHPQVSVLFVVAALVAGLTGLQRPPLDALLPRLVDEHEIAAAGSLDAFGATIGMIAGPAIGGILISAAGVSLAYGFDAATFAVSLVALTMIGSVPPPSGAAPVSLHGVLEGLRYAASRRDLLGTYGVDTIAMFFGMPTALFPALAHRFGGPSALGRSTRHPPSARFSPP